MRKIKILVTSILLIGIVFLLTTNARAEEILVTKSVTTGKGIITYVISGLNIDTTKTYYFTIKTEEGESITAGTRQHLVNIIDEKSVSIELNPNNLEIYTFLTTKDRAKITIQDKDDSIILDAQLIDMTLPVTQAMAFKTVNSAISISAPYKEYAQINYQFVKITDQSLVNDYLKLREEGKDISELNDRLTREIPQNGWLNGNQPNLPTQEGLYYIWGQAISEGKKTISGYILYDNLPKTDNPDENNTTTNDTNIGNENDTNVNENVQNNTISDGNQINNIVINNIIINNNTDNTVNNNKIPNAGSDFIVCGVIALILVIGVAGIAKYKKYKEIK